MRRLVRRDAHVVDVMLLELLDVFDARHFDDAISHLDFSAELLLLVPFEDLDRIHLGSTAHDIVPHGIPAGITRARHPDRVVSVPSEDADAARRLSLRRGRHRVA